MRNYKGHLYLIMSFTMAGTSIIAAKFLTALGTFTITSVCLFLILLILTPYCHVRIMNYLKSLNCNDWIMICFQAVFGIFLFRAFLLSGLKITSSLEAGILISCSPVITSTLAHFFLKEKANAKTFLGVSLAFIGILLLQGINTRLNTSHLLGNLLVLCAAASESVFNTLSRIYSRSKSQGNKLFDPLLQTMLVSFVALILCLLPAFREHPFKSLSILDIRGWLSIIWYGFVVTLLSYILWYAGIKRCNAYTAAAYSCIMPLTSMLLSFIILGEAITGIQWVGSGLILLGVMLITIFTSKQVIAKESQ